MVSKVLPTPIVLIAIVRGIKRRVIVVRAIVIRVIITGLVALIAIIIPLIDIGRLAIIRLDISAIAFVVTTNAYTSIYRSSRSKEKRKDKGKKC